jgi:hypothetical protein
MMEQMTLETYESLLRGHDWFFHYSDDQRYYRRGMDQRNELDRAYNSLKAQDLEVEARQLFNDISPDSFHMKAPKENS